MFTEICIAVIAVAVILLIVVIRNISSQTQRSIQLLQTDLHALSLETTRLLNTMNEFVRSDLHAVAEETRLLAKKLNDLSSDINHKSHSLNFLFKPFSFLSSKLGGGSSSSESPSNCETIPQFIKWIASSAHVIKTTREFIKTYGKRT